MKIVLAILCWSILITCLLACSKHVFRPTPEPVPATPKAPTGVPFEEDRAMPDPDETVLHFGDPKAPTSPIFFDFNSFTFISNSTGKSACCE